MSISRASGSAQRLQMSIFCPGVCVSSALCVCVWGGLSQSVFGLCVWDPRLGIEELGSVGSRQSSQ